MYVEVVLETGKNVFEGVSERIVEDILEEMKTRVEVALDLARSRFTEKR